MALRAAIAVPTPGARLDMVSSSAWPIVVGEPGAYSWSSCDGRQLLADGGAWWFFWRTFPVAVEHVRLAWHFVMTIPMSSRSGFRFVLLYMKLEHFIFNIALFFHWNVDIGICCFLASVLAVCKLFHCYSFCNSHVWDLLCFGVVSNVWMVLQQRRCSQPVSPSWKMQRRLGQRHQRASVHVQLRWAFRVCDYCITGVSPWSPLRMHVSLAQLDCCCCFARAWIACNMCRGTSSDERPLWLRRQYQHLYMHLHD